MTQNRLLSILEESSVKDNIREIIFQSIIKNQLDLARILLEAEKFLGKEDFGLNTVTPHGMTSIQIAAREGNTAAVNLLLDYGADPFQTSQQSSWESAFTLARDKHHDDIVNLILKSSVPLTPDIGSAIIDTVFDEDLELTQKLCEKAGEKIVRTIFTQWLRHGVSPLGIAVKKGNEALVLLLMQYGANPHQVDKHINPQTKTVIATLTPFQLAYELKDESLAIALASHPNFLPPENVGSFVLAAVQKGWVKLTRVLLENAKKYEKDPGLNTFKEENKTSIQIANEQGNVEAMELLLFYGAELDPLNEKIEEMTSSVEQPLPQSREQYIADSYDVKHLDHLTDSYIQNLGNDYIQKYGEQRSFWHRDQPVAKKLRDFKGAPSRARGEFLASCYGELTNHKGTLANGIRQAFESAFEEKINYEGLSVKQVSELLASKAQAYCSLPPSLPVPSIPDTSTPYASPVQTSVPSSPYSHLYPSVDEEGILISPSTSRLYPYQVGNEFINPPLLKETKEELVALTLPVTQQNEIKKDAELISFEEEAEERSASTISSAELLEPTLMDLTEEEIKQMAQPAAQQKAPGLYGLFNQPRQPTSEELVNQLKAISVPKTPLPSTSTKTPVKEACLAAESEETHYYTIKKFK